MEPEVETVESAPPAEIAKQSATVGETSPTDLLAEVKVDRMPLPGQVAKRETSTAESQSEATEVPPAQAPRTPYQPPSIAAIPIPPGTQAKIPPDFTGNLPPRYPAEALANGWEGTVLLRLRINAGGQVEDVVVVQGSGHQILDEAAVAAVRQWRGIAAKRGGRPVASVELFPVEFKPK
jgi:protein TonB